ncbi:MAG: hypothetical protein ACYSOF_10165, partial [Planctomycetota bacterium]
TESKQMELSFEPAVITEIAGPCVRVRTGLPVQIRQRVLLVFDLEEGRLVQDVGDTQRPLVNWFVWRIKLPMMRPMRQRLS